MIFSMLEAVAYKRGFEPDEAGSLAAGLAWPRVLDLFAGSGALGIEALSRGARQATFVEKDREALAAIQTNLRSTGLDDRATVIGQDAANGVTRLSEAVDLVLADPPYDDAGALERAIEALERRSLLEAASVVVLEQATSSGLPEKVGPLLPFRSRTHGKTRVTLYGNLEDTTADG